MIKSNESKLGVSTSTGNWTQLDSSGHASEVDQPSGVKRCVVWHLVSLKPSSVSENSVLFSGCVLVRQRPELFLLGTRPPRPSRVTIRRACLRYLWVLGVLGR